ncbi:MAG: multiubiquitin domain-containing protein [Gemmatimonadota bacterium]|nr:multiubiquitin domain-containing protein [Gemmatimonadota bacterium]
MNQSKQDKYIFFIDGKEIVTEQSSLTGEEIKSMARIPGEYQLFLETQGDEPDQAISDRETVSLGKPTKHFYAVPPATFGRR